MLCKHCKLLRLAETRLYVKSTGLHNPAGPSGVRVVGQGPKQEVVATMGKYFSSRSRACFELPIVPAVIIGTIITALFYAALLYGPVDSPLFKRYCLCHAVAEASVWLFFIAFVGMATKVR